jgi:peptidoglycan/xylan/chitin deacetylase (PgdA/CDA1 family)
VRPSFVWGATWVTPGQFARQIDLALSMQYSFTTLHEYIKQEIDGSKRIAITFDDGYESVYKYAYPVLKQYGIPATVFVLPAFTGKYNTWDVNWGGQKLRHLNWDQIDQLINDGWQIGSHGMHHLDLSRLSDTDLYTELANSKADIEKHNSKPLYLSYPFGNCNHRVVRCARDLGYEGGVVMSRKPANVPEIYAKKRLGVYLFDNSFIYRKKLVANNSRFFNLLQGILDICSDGTVLVKQKFCRQI